MNDALQVLMLLFVLANIVLLLVRERRKPSPKPQPLVALFVAVGALIPWPLARELGYRLDDDIVHGLNYISGAASGYALILNLVHW